MRRLLLTAAFAAPLPGTTIVASSACAANPRSSGCPTPAQHTESAGGTNNQDLRVRQAESEGGTNNSGFGIRRAETRVATADKSEEGDEPREICATVEK
jgi:hypothetical protein